MVIEATEQNLHELRMIFGEWAHDPQSAARRISREVLKAVAVAVEKEIERRDA